MNECDESIIYQMGYNKGFGDGIKGSVPKSVLEDIKAEIQEKSVWYRGQTYDGLCMALEIIDKHIGKAESEDKHE